MNKKKIALFLTALFCINSLLSAKTLTPGDEENSSITMQTFYTLTNVWTDFTSTYQENTDAEEIASALSEYQNQLLKSLNLFLQDFSSDVADSEGDESISIDFYPFILSEIYFYQYIVANKPNFSIIPHSELDEAIKTAMKILLPNDGTENSDSDMQLAENLHTVNRLFSYFDVLTDYENILPTEGESVKFPADYTQQVLLVHAFSRLEIASEDKVSIENIVQLLNDPLAIFLLFYYPKYEYLQNDVLSAITTYEEIFESSIADDLTDVALAAYDFQRLFKKTELSSQTYGIPIELILPPQYENLYTFFRTAPLMTVAFTQKELTDLNNCLDYLSLAGELYVSRINFLAFRPINEGAENE